MCCKRKASVFFFQQKSHVRFFFLVWAGGIGFGASSSSSCICICIGSLFFLFFFVSSFGHTIFCITIWGFFFSFLSFIGGFVYPVVEICSVFLLLLGGLLAIPCMCFQRANFYRFFLLLLLRLLLLWTTFTGNGYAWAFFFFFFRWRSQDLVVWIWGGFHFFWLWLWLWLWLWDKVWWRLFEFLIYTAAAIELI
jgi:hypothetical protein